MSSLNVNFSLEVSNISTERILNKEKFENDVLKNVTCHICNFIPIRPVQKQTHEGVFYCSFCLENYSNEKNLPKNYNESLTYKFLFGKMEICCKNKQNGCNLSFLYKKIDELVIHEKKCDKNQVNCLFFEYCKQKGFQKEIEEHQKNCDFSLLVCEKCLQNLRKKDYNSHSCVEKIVGLIKGSDSDRSNIKLEKSREVLEKTVDKLERENEKLKGEILSLKNQFEKTIYIMNDLSLSRFLKIIMFNDIFAPIISDKFVSNIFQSNQSNENNKLFMKNCLKKEQIIIIIKLTTGEVIGGYSPTYFENGTFSTDDSMKGIIFSLTSSLKFKHVKNPDRALFFSESIGIIFGNNDLKIDNLNLKTKLGSSYQSDDYNVFPNEAKIDFYEVFQINKK